MELVRSSVRVATSKPAQRTYLNTFLFISASTVLFGLACIAYSLFYWNYVPSAGVEKIVHLQFGDGPNPYGLVPLDKIIRNQEYDVALHLDLPRSPRNLENGNFMLQLRLLAAGHSSSSSTLTSLADELRAVIPTAPLLENTVYTTRRPAVMTYHDPLASLSQRLLRIPLYALHLRRESELLKIPLAEAQEFKQVPALGFIEIQNLHERGIEVYSAVLVFKARFRPFSLRWLMYNHRITAFVIFTTSFWMAEVFFAGLGWLVLSFTSGSTSDSEDKEERPWIKKEGSAERDEDEMSDTPRTFPTYGQQPPLKYEPQIKQEEDDATSSFMEEAAIQPLEADDELEDVAEFERGGRSDSGIGTSYSEGGGRSGELLRKRSSRGRS